MREEGQSKHTKMPSLAVVLASKDLQDRMFIPDEKFKHVVGSWRVPKAQE